MVCAHNFEVFLRDGVFNNAAPFSCRRKSGVLRLLFSASLRLRHRKQVVGGMPNQPQAADQDAIIKNNVHVSLDRLLAAGVSQGEEIKASG